MLINRKVDEMDKFIWFWHAFQVYQKSNFNIITSWKNNWGIRGGGGGGCSDGAVDSLHVPPPTISIF